MLFRSGNLWRQTDLHNDNTTPIPCLVGTFEFTGGDIRANDLWNDAVLNCTPGSAITLTPVCYGTAIAAPTIIPASGVRDTYIANINVSSNFLGLQLSWTDNFLIVNSPTSLFFWQPMSETLPITLNIWQPEGTGFGIDGFKFIDRMLIAYRSSAPVTLTITAYDGTSPSPITLPSTGGDYRKTVFPLTVNKGLLFFFSASCASAWQPYLDEWEIHIGQWGRNGPCAVLKDLPKLIGAG